VGRAAKGVRRCATPAHQAQEARRRRSPLFAGRRLEARGKGNGRRPTARNAAIAPKHPVENPPVAPRHPVRRTFHGVTLTDDYAWLKDANWQQVLRNPALLDPDIRSYLKAENRYTEGVLAPTQALQKTLVAEMRGRIKEDDSGVPEPDGPPAYLWLPPRRPA
jgi:hypothetical protein